jgi:hypothetical protein
MVTGAGGLRTQGAWRPGRKGDASAASVSRFRYVSDRGHRDAPVIVVLAVLALLGSASTALAEGGVRWSVSAVSRPTNLHPRGDVQGDEYAVVVTNAGGAPSSGPVVVTDELPPGVGFAGGAHAEDELGGVENAAGHDFSGSCHADGEERKVTCVFEGQVPVDDSLVISLPVHVDSEPPDSCVSEAVVAPAVSCVRNVVRVSGGGAVSAGVVAGESLVSPASAPFGVSSGGAVSSLSSVQAGAHADLTVQAAFDTQNVDGATAGNLKNTTYDLPPGFAGDLVDTPSCAAADFLREDCPIGSQIGVTTIDVLPFGPQLQLQPVYNLAPEPGFVGKIGFWVKGYFYEGDVKVREPGEPGTLEGGPGEPYGLQTTFYDATAGLVEVDSVSLTVWGVPGSMVHDPLRWVPSTGGSENGHFGASSSIDVPYLSNPTSCGSEPLRAAFTVTSWQGQAPPATPMSFGPISGCDALVMSPFLSAQVSTDKASAPTGLDFATRITQTYPNPDVLAAPTLEKEVVSLPEGMTVNPSSGAGLQACSEAQYREEQASERSAQEKHEGHGCPVQSKLATVRISSPSLAEEVTGTVFLATPAPRGEAGRNPFDSLLAVYLVARIPARGVLIKAPGLVQADPLTGRLTTTFEDLPPLPFSLATFSFNQGANAPLVTPPACGNYTVTARLTPWSDLGEELSPLIPPFAITSGYAGGPCPPGGTPPFHPEVLAYPLHGNAGAYSPFYLRISRTDGEQEITGFSTSLPLGLTGNLSGVQKCSEEDVQRASKQTGVQAEHEPACPAGSQIGHTIAEAGVGGVLAQTPGNLYLGQAYEGAPFSIVSVTSAHVGPFDLGTVVVHLPLNIDPYTAQVSVPAGPADQIPHIIKGIVIHLRSIRVYIDRNDFMLNPTSCAAQSFEATVIGSGQNFASPADDMRFTATDPFQLAACQALKFEPRFEVSTQASDSFNQNGASLTTKVTEPAGALGTQANIARVKVELPLALPSRLTTLQKACLASVFEADPAACPPASHIGYALVHTPILPVPLQGPAIFVSHGNEAFPSLTIVLQGDGVTIDLVGSTFISHKGITSTTFKTVPDQPFETFELTLPQGKYSALAATTNVCKPTTTKTVKKRVVVRRHGKALRRHGKVVKRTRKVTKKVAAPLIMPTELVGQNGAVIHEQTHISVTGCKQAKPAKKHKRKHRHKKQGHGKGRKGGKR